MILSLLQPYGQAANKKAFNGVIAALYPLTWAALAQQPSGSTSSSSVVVGLSLHPHKPTGVLS